MYKRILAAIDATPNEAEVLAQTIQLARLTGATVQVLHVALDHIGTGDILGGSAATDDVDPREVTVVQDALAQLREAGVTAAGELMTAPEHEIAAAIVERAKTLDVQLIVLGHTLHRGVSKLFRASVAEQVIHQHPSASILLVP
jgi:nucleotide-binding universal stress UspA family protein